MVRSIFDWIGHVLSNLSARYSTRLFLVRKSHEFQASQQETEIRRWRGHSGRMFFGAHTCRESEVERKGALYRGRWQRDHQGDTKVERERAL